MGDRQRSGAGETGEAAARDAIAHTMRGGGARGAARRHFIVIWHTHLFVYLTLHCISDAFARRHEATR